MGFCSTVDCDRYILPINTIWLPRDRCEENKRFRCRKGYVSQVQTICKGGYWVLEPTCQAVECPQGVNITNSDDVTESGIFEEVFSFDCSVGFTQNGVTGILSCDENGTWTEQKACQAVECPQGENITLSDGVTESSIVGGLFNFSCSVGFIETGTLGCEENGTWTKQKACQVVLKAVGNKGIPMIIYA
ncbi:hypothetical protein LOTGIDRAFT_173255 [Lottia gigantea]|uniref:Sushi domain-containing protein n=1 Tax=Lottia gigantea TaxID=225164 RepID=V4B259_LOTGI|nr:hypothetical protein LOTGIDRAFT_173255 [Lottia gigantea]ESP00352.1 hypothetical protein LOTGIDRAFT_173255 [Lottia gigantea]